MRAAIARGRIDAKINRRDNRPRAKPPHCTHCSIICTCTLGVHVVVVQGVLGIVGRLEKETDAPRVGAPSTGCTRRLDGYADEVTVRIPVQLRQSNSKESENGRVIQLQQLPDERRCGTAGTPASLCPVSAPHACRSRPARSYSLLGVVSRPSSSGATTSTALQVHPP